ncbi:MULTISPECIES: flagellin [unclassified Polaromonas]|uniref:flagellin N-terminal helical domain-containing protein n=1 Tax=unclassified Polaromonas TaxID=2638319 RepID=UPI0018C9B4A3|nr:MULTISPECIES: flagellin [unclassified Polaromonas]MBG6070493.1 flagellin [Polaromonas sp. CG_9.7]MBG6112491.1 flagellin [Polaromonas sp. CG_9.2]
MSVINTNILSLVTQNNLTKSQGAMNTAIERLSSGMRINSAKDDAAGQAIANRFTASIKGLTQASRNANDGISMAQTTEGALNEVNTNLQRIRELTVQSANGSNSDADKASMQAEITQRMAEIDRTSAQTDFNGVKVLSSSAKELSVQVGAYDGETIKIGLTEISSTTLGLTGFNVDGKTAVANAAAAAADLAGFTKAATANTNGSYTYSKDVTTANTAATSANVFSKLATNDTVNYTGTTNGLGKAADSNTYKYNAASSSFSFNVADATNANVITYLTPTTGSASATVTIGTNASQNIKIGTTGAITAADDGAVLYLDSVGNLSKTQAGGAAAATVTSLAASMSTITSGTGGSIAVGGTVLTADKTTGGVFDVVDAKITSSALATATSGGYTATVNASGGNTTYTVASGGAVTNGNGAVYADASGTLSNDASTKVTTTYYAQANGKVTDNTGAQIYKTTAGALTLAASTTSLATADPLKALDAALKKVDDLRGSLGAVQNRFDSVIANLGTTIVNLSSSRSRIEDADYATEVSNMTRAQLLQQAGTSVLAKSNQSTEGVMSLLR